MKFFLCIAIVALLSVLGVDAREAKATPGPLAESVDDPATILRGAEAEEYQLNQQLQWFSKLIKFISEAYVDPKNSKELIDAAISGMVKSLDPHSVYLPAKAFTRMQTNNEGKFVGLGIEVTVEDGLIKVVSPIDDTPAVRAGIKSGDFITHVNGRSIYDMPIEEAIGLMRGPIGTECILTIWRKDQGDPFDVTIVRATINIVVVKGRVEGKIAYIRLAVFNEQTYESLLQTYADLHKEIGDDVRGLILDLRNNPGGLLGPTLSIADAFIGEGQIMSVRPRNEEQAQTFDAKPNNEIAVGLPMVILINSGSASASEIIAGSLQDHNRAIIVGTKSFGKGSVQAIIPLPDGGALKMTTARYYLPSGRSIQASGINPDVVVRPGKIQFDDEQKVRKEADLRGRLESRGIIIKEETPVTEVDDYQLQRALDIIRVLYYYSEMRK